MLLFPFGCVYVDCCCQSRGLIFETMGRVSFRVPFRFRVNYVSENTSAHNARQPPTDNQDHGVLLKCHTCLPAERTTLGGAQAPTHSFPLRLAPRRQQQKQSRRRPTHAPTKQQPTRRTTIITTITTNSNQKFYASRSPAATAGRRRHHGARAQSFGYLARGVLLFRGSSGVGPARLR
jgi:hypothetical protein